MRPEIGVDQLEVEIPPLTSAADWRGPLERYLEVPDDIEAATQWAHDLTEITLSDCMAERGFAYTKQPFKFPEDVNAKYVEQLVPEDLEAYANARWEREEPGSCRN